MKYFRTGGRFKWLSVTIPRAEVSKEMNESTHYQGTIANISKHAAEIEAILAGSNQQAVIISTDPTVEDPSEFAFEKHLGRFPWLRTGSTLNWERIMISTRKRARWSGSNIPVIPVL